MIRANFNVKKIEKQEASSEQKFEELIAKSGVGSHMVFRSENKDEEFFIDEI